MHKKSKEITCMKNIIATAAAIMLLTCNAHAADSSVKEVIKILCASQVDPNPNDEPSRQAAQIYAMMKESERHTCGVRGDDFVNYLINKYQSRINS